MFVVSIPELIGARHGRIVAELGKSNLKKTLLPSLLDGNILVGVGLTEPECGSDLSSIKTFARRHKDGYILSGEKNWVSRVDEADYFVVFAKTQNIGVHGLTAFLVN